MKRISQGSSTSLNDPNFQSLKPLFGTKGNPPYYDPNDLHVHVWKRGKLGIEDDPKVPTYAKGKLVIKDCVYCKICHTIKNSFQNTVTKDVVDDIIHCEDAVQVDKGYKIVHNLVTNLVTIPFTIEEVCEISSTIPNYVDTTTNLFHNDKEEFNEYVTIS